MKELALLSVILISFAMVDLGQQPNVLPSPDRVLHLRPEPNMKSVYLSDLCENLSDLSVKDRLNAERAEKDAEIRGDLCRRSTPTPTKPVNNQNTPGAPSYVRPTPKARFKAYLLSMFGPLALGKNVASAGWGTWRKSPTGWDTHWDGFGKRFASSVGKGIVSNTTRFGLEEAFGLDSSYYRSSKKDIGSRIKNALISTVTARDRSGKRVFGFPHIVGTYTGSIVAAEAWYPPGNDWRDGLKSGTVSLGLDAAFNVVREFIHR